MSLHNGLPFPNGFEMLGGSPWTSGPQPYATGLGTTTVALGAYDSGFYHINSYCGPFQRGLFVYNNMIYVAYIFKTNSGGSACGATVAHFINTVTDVSQINHPIVQMAKYINTSTGQVSSGVDTQAMPYIGLPEPQQFVSQWTSVSGSGGNVYDSGAVASSAQYDVTHKMIPSNFCYLGNNASTSSIVCVFGPS